MKDDLNNLNGILMVFCLFIFIAPAYSRSPSRIEKGVLPFEGCQYGVWICEKPVKMYFIEGDYSSFAHQLEYKDTLNAVTGDIYYDRFGKIVVTKPIYEFLPNDTLTALRCCGEFNFFIYKDDSVYCTPIFWPILAYEEDLNDEAEWKAYQSELQDTSYAGVMIKRPQFTWWIKIIHNGEEGWIACKNETPYCFAIKEDFRGMDPLYDH